MGLSGCLRKVLKSTSAAMPYLTVDPFWYGIRSDARYGDLLRRIGLPEPAE